MSNLKEENPNLSAADKNVIMAITNAWKVLHVLGVSLAEVGRYWASAGDEAGRQALQQVLQPATVRGIFAAEDELRTALNMLSPDAEDELEAVSELLKYWEGPTSPNENPVLDLVTKVAPVSEDDDPET